MRTEKREKGWVSEMTNGGKVRAMINSDRAWAMTDEELAGLCDGPAICPPNVKCCDDCKKCWFNWLKAPADEHGGDGK